MDFKNPGSRRDGAPLWNQGTQENRMTAYLVNDIKAQQLFIEGKDQHQEEADKLRISRDMAKIVVHGLT